MSVDNLGIKRKKIDYQLGSHAYTCGTRFCLLAHFARTKTPTATSKTLLHLPPYVSIVSYLTLHYRNITSMTLAVTRKKACTLTGTYFSFDRGDSPSLPSSVTGSGRLGELPSE